MLQWKPSICYYFCAWFSRDDFRELNHRKQLIPRKSLKAVYERTVISNNAPRNGLLYSKNISSKFVTVSGDPRITDLCIGQIEASTCPPGHTPGIWHLCRPGEEGIWWSESSRGWGIWSPCFRGGEFELHLRFHVKSLTWLAIMGDPVWEDFREKDCAFVANWLRGRA